MEIFPRRAPDSLMYSCGESDQRERRWEENNNSNYRIYEEREETTYSKQIDGNYT